MSIDNNRDLQVESIPSYNGRWRDKDQNEDKDEEQSKH